MGQNLIILLINLRNQLGMKILLFLLAVKKKKEVKIKKNLIICKKY